MEALGINWNLFIAQIVNIFVLLFLLIWPILSIRALFALRKRRLGETPRVLWVMVIVLVPVLGALAFWIVGPEEV